MFLGGIIKIRIQYWFGRALSIHLFVHSFTWEMSIKHQYMPSLFKTLRTCQWTEQSSSPLWSLQSSVYKLYYVSELHNALEIDKWHGYKKKKRVRKIGPTWWAGYSIK